jgi:cytochrome c peroxidase
MTSPLRRALLALACGSLLGLTQAAGLSPKEQLGKSIFFDSQLSLNSNQSCATCHAPQAGWTGPDSDVNAGGAVYEGSVAGRFGDRKPSSSAYATQSPVFHRGKRGGEWIFIGGNFWDGRATGEKLGNPAADQAQGPFLNPLEQALPDAACVVHRVCTATGYAVSFTAVWGAASCHIAWPLDMAGACAAGGKVSLTAGDRARADSAYDRIALSIAAYEASSESNAFSSKFDRARKGQARLTADEQRGFALFKGKGKCASCHSATPAKGGGALFTDYTFDNLGLPRNPDLPFYAQAVSNPEGSAWIDRGLGGFLGSHPRQAAQKDANVGKHRVPTLRNVDRRPSAVFVKAYGHNGYFKSLKGIVHFYNTRDTKPVCKNPFTREADALAQQCWPLSEVPNNVNATELGNLGLTPAEEDAIVAFLRTLSDGYVP